MDPSTRSTTVATAVIVGLVLLSIAVLFALGSGPSPSAAPTGPTGGADPLGVPTPPPGVPGTPSMTLDPSQPSTPGGPSLSADGEVCIPQVTERALTVMTFNIKSGRVNGRVDMVSVGNQIAVYRPDIVLLQEVDKGRPISAYLDEAAVLGTQLKMQWTFGGNDVRSPTNFLGNAILSRYPIMESNNIQLPALPGKHRRGLLGALVDVSGIKVEVFSTHLEHTSGDDRERQVRSIATLLGPRTAPRFIGGDFNATPVGPTMATARSFATDTWLQVGTGPGFTAPSRNPKVRIDYLMYDGSDKVTITPQQMQVLPTNSSDHRAVMASYTLRRDDGEICVPRVEGTG